MDFQNAKRAVYSVDLQFEGPPERVFPLLCPVREYEWIEGWSCTMVYAKSGVAEATGIFRRPSPDLGDEIWTISRYEPNRAIEFVRVAWNVMVTKLDFALEPAGETRTLARVTHTLTALGPAGEAVLALKTPEGYAREGRALELMANHFLRTGQRLVTHPTQARPTAQ
jgi:hypothetical protein